MKDRLCALCGGELVERVETVARDLPDQGTVLVRHLPVRLCRQCGHRWLSQDTMERIERLLEGGQSPAEVREVPVFDLAC